jgi:hypothetical protein
LCNSVSTALWYWNRQQYKYLNVAGQLIKQPAIKIVKGYNQVKVAVNDIKQGMYLLKINKGELNMVRRFVIAR